MSDMFSENEREIKAESQISVENVANELKEYSIVNEKRDEEEKEG